MTDKKRFFRDGLLMTAVGVAMRTVSLFFSSYVSRAVGAEGVGLFSLVLSVYGFAATFATAGISLTVTRLVAAALGEGREGDVGRILRAALGYALAFSGLSAAVLLLGADAFAVRVLNDARCAAPLRILAPSLLPLSLLSVYSGYFVGVRRVTHNAAVQIAGQIAKIALTVFLVSRLPRGSVAGAAIALAVGSTFTEALSFLVIFAFYLADRKKHGQRTIVPTEGKISSSFFFLTLPLTVSACLRDALLTVEHILIPRSLMRRGETASAALAAYGILHGMALPLVLYPMAALSSFSGLLVPEFAARTARGEARSMAYIAERAFSATLRYSVSVAVLLALFSEELGYTVYASGDAGRYVLFLSPVVPIMYLDHLTDSLLKGVGEQVFSMWINISDAAISILLVVLLLPRLGIAGYAVVIVVMEAYNFLLSFLRLRRRVRVRIGVFRSLVFPALAGALAALLTKELFLFAGRNASPLWLAAEILFASCLMLAADRAASLVK